MEPTANAIHAGCLGNINATWTFTGARGTRRARGWPTTRSTRAAAGIHALAQVPPDAARVRRAALHRGRLGDAGRRRDRRQRRPRRGGRARQLPLRARSQRRGGRGAGCASCASRTARWRIDGNAPSAPVAIANPMAQRLIGAGDLAVEPKQAWTPVAEFAAAGVDAVNFGPGDPPQAHTRDEHVRSRRARALLRDDRGLRMRLNPVLAGMANYPFLRLTEAKRAATARGVDIIDFGIGEPREVDAGVHPASRSSRRSRPSRSRPTRPPRACPSCARRSRAGRSGASARRSTPTPRSIPTQGSKEAIFHLAQVVAGRGRPRRRSPRPAIPSRRAARCSPARRWSSCRSTPRAAGSRTSTPSTGTASRCCG